jgi:acyl-CoA synthetase (AMP-forming)/AMP-acid ligase II
MILVGGFNCYPREVEEVLYEHPKVALAAVIGVPDDRSGEKVKAYRIKKRGLISKSTLSNYGLMIHLINFHAKFRY